ncbi:MAG: hypothetical protein ACTSYI_07705 [Promethearchaeota archaeon]
MQSDSNTSLPYRTGSDYWTALQQRLIIPVSPPQLNELLRGGILPELVYHFTIPRQMSTKFLLQLTVNAYHTYSEKYSLMDGFEVYFIDTLNRFDPYVLAKDIRALGHSVNDLLQRVQVMRAFTWSSLVGGLEDQLAQLPPVIKGGIRLIIGNFLFGDFETEIQEAKNNSSSKAFLDVKAMIRVLQKAAGPQTYLVLTGPLHSKSNTLPVGGTLLTHLANVHVRMGVSEKYHRFTLDQHPFLASSTIRIPISPKSKFSKRKSRRQIPKGFQPSDHYLYRPKKKRFVARGLDDFL